MSPYSGRRPQGGTQGDRFSATRLPAGASFDPAAGLLRWAPTNSDAGEHTMTFLVTDDGDPQRSATMSVTVRVEAAAPADVGLSIFADWGGGWCGDLL
ncbi:MAG: putative Ig domain-containing protein [Deltaproteobacteria bacterium]|nr:putative Ig domain-containing protein [Deltaproteobacteria bacterium]